MAIVPVIPFVPPIIPFVRPIVPAFPGVPPLFGAGFTAPGVSGGATITPSGVAGGINVSLPGGGLAGISVGPGGISGGLNLPGLGGVTVAAGPGGIGVSGGLSLGPLNIGLATSDFSQLFAGGGSQRQWGIFTENGGPILPVDAVHSVEYAKEFRISDYPQEKGAFASYNKVQMPFQAKIGFLLKGTRVAFLQGVFKQMASLEFVTIVTPEISYPSANLVHFGYRRVAREGVSMMLVEVWVNEVRVTGVAGQVTDTASPNGATPGQNGQTTPNATTPSPTNPVTGTMVSGLPNQNQPTPSDPASLPSPNVSPAFYNPNNIPEVPNEVSKLSGPQQSTGLSYGQSLGVTSQTVGPTSSSQAGVSVPLAPENGLGNGAPPAGSTTSQYNFSKVIASGASIP